METIESDIQEQILNILPDDYETSVNLMCQLLANIMLSGKGVPFYVITNKIKNHVIAYQGT